MASSNDRYSLGEVKTGKRSKAKANSIRKVESNRNSGQINGPRRNARLHKEERIRKHVDAKVRAAVDRKDKTQAFLETEEAEGAHRAGRGIPEAISVD